MPASLSPVDTLEAQLPIYWVPVLKFQYEIILSRTQGPTIWVPGLLGTSNTVKDGGKVDMYLSYWHMHYG